MMKFRLLLPQIKRALIVLQNSYYLYSFMTPPWNLIPDIHSYILFNHSLSVLYCTYCTRTSTLLIHKFLYLQAPSTKNHSLYPLLHRGEGLKSAWLTKPGSSHNIYYSKKVKKMHWNTRVDSVMQLCMYFQRSFALEEKTAAGLSIGGWLWIDGEKMYCTPLLPFSAHKSGFFLAKTNLSIVEGKCLSGHA